MNKYRVWAIVLIVAGLLIGSFVYYSQVSNKGVVSKFPFKLGLDLNGGSHLVYKADVSKIAPADVGGAMDSLRDVIENRINIFGVSEPLVQTETANISGEKVNKLVVELPGITDLNKAIEIIGKTPKLEFMTEQIASSTDAVSATSTAKAATIKYIPTGLDGKFLQKASLQFDTRTQEPLVNLKFNDEGTKLFDEITKANIGKVVAIFLDGRAISTPVVRDEISDGSAQISGGSTFTPDEAKTLVRDLNYGALPVPVELIGTQSIGPSLGADALKASVNAGIWGFIIIALFLVLWYRLPGLIAVVSLAIYTAINLAVFKLIPVTLTSAGLAGFILSIGMAVDGNILIFERTKEELKRGLGIEDAIREGFSRAWLSIRDSNTSSIITSIILYTFATTALIKGFALVFFIGVVVSMFTSITVSRTFLLAIGVKKNNGLMKFLFSNGLSK